MTPSDLMISPAVGLDPSAASDSQILQCVTLRDTHGLLAPHSSASLAGCSLPLTHPHGSSCWHVSPPTHSPTPVAGTQTTLQTEQTVHDPEKQLEMEFNEKTGQTLLIGIRAWQDKHTDK